MYKIITGKGGMSLEVAKQQIKEMVMKQCNQNGWKLQGGAEVRVTRHSDFTWYEIYQTLVEGNQNLIDYDVIEVTTLCDTLSGVSKKCWIS